MANLFSFDVATDFSKFAAGLSEIQQQNLPFVMAYALTNTAKDIRAAEVEKMREVFDRPSRFALNALQVIPATKHDLRAAVTFKEGFGSIPARRYLGPQVEGGSRSHKSHEKALIAAGVMRSTEYAVPSRLMPLDANGNVPGSVIVRMLSDVRAQRDPANNSTAKTRKRRRKAGRGVFVAMRDGKAPGIYFRLGMRDLRPMLLFVRAPRYTQRYPYYATASHVVDQRLPVHFVEGMRRYGNSRRPG
jgi:hypothetical protein